MIKLIACGLLIFPLIPFQSPTSVNTESRSVEGAKVAEALYRYQMQHCYPEIPDKIYFLGFYDGTDEKDPTDELMNKFKGHRPPVKKHSQMLHQGKNHEFMDKESGKAGVLLSIEGIKWVSETEVEVNGSCGAADWAAEGYRYRIVLEGDHWVVKGDKRAWVL